MTVPAPDCGIPTPAAAGGGDAEARLARLRAGRPGPLEMAARQVMTFSPAVAAELVGSRTEDGRDDRGVYWADLVSRMASSYVRLHYLIYQALREHGQDGEPSLNMLEGQRNRSVFLPFTGLGASLGLPLEDAAQVAHSAMPVLAREGLIGSEWGAAPSSVLRFPGAEGSGLHAVPTHPGVELFLWAHGKRATNLSVLLMPEYDLPDFGEHLSSAQGALVGPIR